MKINLTPNYCNILIWVKTDASLYTARVQIPFMVRKDFTEGRNILLGWNTYWYLTTYWQLQHFNK